VEAVRVLIGYDIRESDAARVASKTLREVTKGEVEPEFLRAPKLADHGLLTRNSDHRGGQDYDLVSNAPSSTHFAISRFLTPILCQDGYALFVDCDVIFLRDPREIMHNVDPRVAVSVVKYNHAPTRQYKMVNQKQTAYPRKNWSSVMLFNANHPANRRLTLHDINHRPGRDLHAFYWLHDDEIGTLAPGWNWLVGEQPMPDDVGIAHFTNGGPWLQGWAGAEHDDLWLRAAG
jgi:hypothetical protein